jgi:hypothetical protein
MPAESVDAERGFERVEVGAACPNVGGDPVGIIGDGPLDLYVCSGMGIKHPLRRELPHQED